MKAAVFLCSSLMMIGSAVAARQPFARYQTVVDRQMFGALPPGFDPSKMPDKVAPVNSKNDKKLSEEQEKLKSAIHFSVLNKMPDGEVEVGFTDNTDPKDPRHYFIREGETRAGWTVDEVDPDTATMVLVKKSQDGDGDIRLELTLGDNSAKGGGKIHRETPGAAAARPQELRGAGGSAISSRKRRRMREEESARKQEEMQRQLTEAKEQSAADKARREQERVEENAKHEQERAESMAQLLAIQEELKRIREANKERKESESAEKKDGDEPIPANADGT